MVVLVFVSYSAAAQSKHARLIHDSKFITLRNIFATVWRILVCTVQEATRRSTRKGHLDEFLAQEVGAGGMPRVA